MLPVILSILIKFSKVTDFLGKNICTGFNGFENLVEKCTWLVESGGKGELLPELVRAAVAAAEDDISTAAAVVEDEAAT